MHTEFTHSDLNIVNELLKNGSRSFYAASFMLPKHIRNPAKALYSFCRIADDEIDHSIDPVAALDRLNKRVDNIYTNKDLTLVEDRALASVVQSYGIPKEIILSLLDGFAWDTKNLRFNNLSELYSYCVRVAGSVGIMMSLIMGKRAQNTLSRACDLGIGMQLTNIARDVGEDARAGRLYLPLHWFKEFDMNANKWLDNPVCDERITSMIDRLLSIAEVFYQRADAGIAVLPNDCRKGIYATRLLYSEIGNQIKRQGLDSVSSRAVVGGMKKMHLLSSIFTYNNLHSENLELGPLPEARYLVESIEVTNSLKTEKNPVFQKYISPIEKNISSVLDLFEKLEQRDRQKHITAN